MRLLALLGVLIPVLARAAEPTIDYNRDVRPILSNHCFKCHGPATQKSGVRLDSLQQAQKKSAIVPGKPGESEALSRVRSQDDGDRMPPAGEGIPLTKAQVDVLEKWIASGAKYEQHWAFTPPKKVALPATGKHPVDEFINATLEKNKLIAAPLAEKTTLIRRVYLDLLGLLPGSGEVDAFLKDSSPDAFAILVDKLLASEHYGERQARHWLDLARYADSNGYTVDGARSIWPYRDWVINAFNADMPFDRFTTEQLAGDLLPNATKEQLIATGFHRNTSFNEEGGTDPEQFRVERVVDRTNTTGTVWMGLTFQCSQCHDHKYDPISQRDYYRLYAFFNSSDEPTLPVTEKPEASPELKELQKQLEQLRKTKKTEEIKKLEAEIKKLQPKPTTTLIIRESSKPRESYIQVRGDFLRKGEIVQPGYLTPVSPTPKGKLNRLDLAKWLMSSEHPLTSRVTVNRVWQQFFGKGLVETENDFGMQGSLPTHPELLDWLAVEFREQGWSFKKLIKLIVTSEAYQRSSRYDAKLVQRDPLNKLLARQNRLRLEAEIIRDAGLSASGLLTRKVGGPGVYPPQPAEVFALTQSRHPWPESQGEDRYRRGMYTFLWRQSQHHLLTTFDGADAQVACTRRNRSNTPLQALHLANDPAFVEFFAALGKRLVQEAKDDPSRVELAFKLCFARSPSDEEKARVLSYLKTRGSDPLKAWTAVARGLMNLDEFVTRE